MVRETQRTVDQRGYGYEKQLYVGLQQHRQMHPTSGRAT